MTHSATTTTLLIISQQDAVQVHTYMHSQRALLNSTKACDRGGMWGEGRSGKPDTELLNEKVPKKTPPTVPPLLSCRAVEAAAMKRSQNKIAGFSGGYRRISRYES